MSSIFLLYEGQALPIRYRPNARARGLKLTCSLGGDLLLTAPPGTPQQALYRFLEANRDRIGRQVMPFSSHMASFDFSSSRIAGSTCPTFLPVRQSSASAGIPRA